MLSTEDSAGQEIIVIIIKNLTCLMTCNSHDIVIYIMIFVVCYLLKIAGQEMIKD